MWNGTGEETDTSVNSTRSPRPCIHPRTVSCSPSSVHWQHGQFQCECLGKLVQYAEAARTRSCAEHRQSSRCRSTGAHKTSVIHDDDNSCICICDGLQDSTIRSLCAAKTMRRAQQLHRLSQGHPWETSRTSGGLVGGLFQFEPLSLWFCLVGVRAQTQVEMRRY